VVSFVTGEKMTVARVLIVDDELYIQEILKSTLEDVGYECVAVGGADEALATLAVQEFDITFADIRMPGKQGTELLQEIRAAYPEIIVIMVTAVDNANTAIESMRLGAYDYIIKPFNLDQVLIAADRALDKRRLEKSSRDYQKYLLTVRSVGFHLHLRPSDRMISGRSYHNQRLQEQ
jgi:DNA-binding NtrC family response regulator